jgi:hypothetical protein
LPSVPPAAQGDAIFFRARLAQAYAEAGHFDEAAKAAAKTWKDARAMSSIRALTELMHVQNLMQGHESHPLATFFTTEADLLAIESSTGVRAL